MKSFGVLVLLFLGFQQNIDLDKIDAKLFDKINVVRVENKCSKLKRDENLDKAATNQAKYIASKDILEHDQNENPKTKKNLDRVKFFSKDKYVMVAENLLFTTIPKETIDSEVLAEKMKSLWVKSPNHFKNIKNSEYNYTGFGFAFNESKTKIYAVQVFGEK
ncbi:CAP domain-containing protein [Flavobacterium sp. F372]|uniref:CAP domain-containing protein n=1 Tax=Flavobacterium bernardetii TaxID=2813823 RepID=A0ABR7J2H2_9FLAO|nr:CAP domain-containing protein [Flavobacterium bernardetii]MBC5836044.1 CAP domain-containing protein [Flavobacterium bernardetii]NHF71216.1 CAP domain-containing protein [Flavobacterium bernardetii]